MLAEPVANMEREKARELWESISVEPEVAQERQAERKRLLARADQLGREAIAAKAQAVKLEVELSRARDERLNHPLVYAGAAGLLGLGALWFFERRKRMRLQDTQLDAWAQAPSRPAHQQTSASPGLVSQDLASTQALSDRQATEIFPELSDASSVFSLEDSPDLAQDFATDLLGLAESPALASSANSQTLDRTPILPDKSVAITPHVPKQVLEPAPVPQLTDKLNKQPVWAQPEPAPLPEKILPSLASGEEWVPATGQTQDGGLLSMSKRVWGNMLRRRSQRDALPSSHLPTEISVSSHQSSFTPTSFKQSSLNPSEQHNDATQMLYDDEAQLAFEQELLEQQLSTDRPASYNPDQANIDLLSQTRITPQRGESAMEHLLELRTAVSGLCALGRPEGAAKLLEEHIAADPGTCAWAYLEYMHICEMLNQRDEFESTRKRYRQHFNRMAPYWHEPNSNVLGLDGYARAASELCAVWSQGRDASFAALAAWLAGPLLGRKLVQLPAYHDLFDLYELLEFVDDQPSSAALEKVDPAWAGASMFPSSMMVPTSQLRPLGQSSEPEQEFVPTVSLLDLDYEFSSDVTLQEREVAQSEKAVTVVKTGNFSVDFNVAGTQMGALSSLPAELAKK